MTTSPEGSSQTFIIDDLAMHDGEANPWRGLASQLAREKSEVCELVRDMFSYIEGGQKCSCCPFLDGCDRTLCVALLCFRTRMVELGIGVK